MRSLQRAALLATVFMAPVLRADVTVRYKNDFQSASFLPAGAMPSKSSVPQLSVMRLKGSKAYADLGAFSSVIDVGSGEITLIDADHKKFAKAPFKDYENRVEEALAAIKPVLSPEAQKTLDSMKSSVALKKTGRTDVIQGVQAEETEMTVLIDMALPEGLPQAGPMMRVVMQFWGARPEEAPRVPAIRQLAGFSAYNSAVMNPFEMIEKTLAHVPGMSQDFAPKLRELASNSPLLLKSHVALFMPMMAQLAQQMEKQGQPLPAGFDPSAPLIELNTEIVEMSVDAIQDSVFDVPADFEIASFDEILKTVTAPAAAVGNAKK
ncbi:MAG: hypothetical protein LAP38_01650 [Acidobacteriia bacterium]|nr:hypothetical protein [Terriglobia bacterium]